MNREILFRGKQIDNGEWIEGIPIKYQSFPDWWNSKEPSKLLILSSLHDGEDGGLDAENYYEVDPSTVCEVTGLTDRSGVKIFEGDIIEAQTQDTKQLRNAEVRFGEFADINSDEDECYIGFYIAFDGIFTTAGQLKEFSNSIEVIGNIFDNPELLEENNT